MTVATGPRVRTSDALAAFLHSLDAMDADQMLDDAPGLPGVWRAGQLRQGLKQHAICVHHEGEHLAATSGPSFNNWQRDIAYWLESGPVSPRKLPEVVKGLPKVALPDLGGWTF